jgi:hypothetical protein
MQTRNNMMRALTLLMAARRGDGGDSSLLSNCGSCKQLRKNDAWKGGACLVKHHLSLPLPLQQLAERQAWRRRSCRDWQGQGQKQEQQVLIQERRRSQPELWQRGQSRLMCSCVCLTWERGALGFEVKYAKEGALKRCAMLCARDCETFESAPPNQRTPTSPIWPYLPRVRSSATAPHRSRR